MTQFKVGPAKTRDGRDAIVVTIRPDCITGTVYSNAAKMMAPMVWFPSGQYFSDDETCHMDLMPNNLPEKIEFECTWKISYGVVLPQSSVNSPKELMNTLKELMGKRTRVTIEVLE